MLEQIAHVESPAAQVPANDLTGEWPAGAAAFIQVYLQQVTEGY